MLGVYTEAIGNCDGMFEAGEQAGLVLQKRTFFFGCASAIFGFRPKCLCIEMMLVDGTFRTIADSLAPRYFQSGSGAISWCISLP